VAPNCRTGKGEMENAGLEKARPNYRTGNLETRKPITKLQDWKTREWIGYGKMIKPKQQTYLYSRC